MSDTQLHNRLYSFKLQIVENYVHMKPIYCSTHQIFVHINENMYVCTYTNRMHRNNYICVCFMLMVKHDGHML